MSTKNKKPIIAVDVDDVLASSAEDFVAYSNKKWGTRLTVDDYTEHWAEMWGVDQKELQKRAQHIYKSGIQKSFRRFDEAETVLRELANKYDLVITTSRHRLVQKSTLEWLDRHFKGIFSEIHFAGIWDAGHETLHALNLTKADLHQRLGVAYMIDDHPKHCFAAANVGVQALLFGDYKWNRDTNLPKNVTRVKDWQSVKDFFDAKR